MNRQTDWGLQVRTWDSPLTDPTLGSDSEQWTHTGRTTHHRLQMDCWGNSHVQIPFFKEMTEILVFVFLVKGDCWLSEFAAV